MPKRSSANGRKEGGTHRAALLEKKSEVLMSLGLKSIHFATAGSISEEDQAQVSHDEFIALRLNGLDYAQLRLVEEALDRLDNGDYGVCLGCGEPISAKRLHVLPWARHCVKCQEELALTEQEETPRPPRHQVLSLHL
jgi:DnaK suppressor protein